MNFELKLAILKSGMKQIVLAREIDIPESRMSKIVNEHIRPTLGEQRMIAEKLNVKRTDLWPE